MTARYTAVEVSEPGKLQLVERPLSEPAAGQLRIRVEACGVCHTDAATVTGSYPGLTLPRVPGHEVVGRIDVLGSGVSRWAVGQRVGVGFFGGEDGVCEPCRRGDIVNCQNPIQLSAFPLVFGRRAIYGALTGTAIDNEDTLAFSVLENVRPMIETRPLEQAADAYARMMEGKARFRMVLTMRRA